jgi:hypothetical protein
MAVVSLHCRSFFALTLVDHFYEHLQKLRNAESGFSLVLCEIRQDRRQRRIDRSDIPHGLGATHC